MFEPITINGKTIRNRLMMAGMDTNLGDAKGRPTQDTYDYYELRAKGGVGMIIVEGTYFDIAGRGTSHMLSISKFKNIFSLRKLSSRIHKQGAKALVQMYHAGNQATSFLIGEDIVGPSAIPSKLTKVVPKPLSKKEIKKLVKDYARAARRLKWAGFDGVEIHAGHGYLINQFFSPLYNKRTDEYGGSLENRMRLAIEILHAIRKKCGKKFIIGFRINCNDYIEGGLEIKEMVKIATKLETEGADLLNITGGIFDSPYYPIVPYMNLPRNVYAKHASKIKQAVKNIPVSVVGRINTPDAAEEILEKEQADMVTLGRALIADPFFPEKVKSGNKEEIRICPACNACLNQILIEEEVACAINPDVLGNENKIIPSEDKKKVLIVGAGPAGLQAAITATLRGHEVIVIEKEEEIGGNLRYATTAPMKEELNNVLEYFKQQIKKHSINIKTNTPYSKEVYKKFQPDLVILATGSEPRIPEINNLNKVNYYTYEEILTENFENLGKQSVVIGGGMIGLEIANYLSHKDKKITIIEENSTIGYDLYSLVASEIVRRTFDDKNIEVKNTAEIEKISKNQIEIDMNGEKETIDFDSLIIALEAKPNNTVESLVRESTDRVFKIGDCKRQKTRKLLDATREAHQLALSLETAKPMPSLEDFDLSNEQDVHKLLTAKIRTGNFTQEDIPDYLSAVTTICNDNKKIQNKTKNTSLSFQISIEYGPQYWIKVENGHFSSGTDSLENPDVTIIMTKSIATGILTGDINASAAYLNKTLQFDGSLRHGMKFQTWTNIANKELGLVE
jgi:2,4-dienoyl-CoA reductase-like NADH-dependent reductase (Old Yellow Enzyme family)/thioredoxin reductase/putative sterol carrier protein